MVMIPTGTKYTVTVAGSRRETVKCDKCGQVYFYRLARMGTGTGSSSIISSGAGAQDRAYSRAEGAMGSRLKAEAELVPCPDCNWINQSLVDRFKKAYIRINIAMLLVFILTTMFVMPPLFYFLVMRNAPEDSSLRGVSVFFTLGSAVWVVPFVLLRNRRRALFDPNKSHPNPPELPVCTPLALIEGDRSGPKGRQMLLVPRPETGGKTFSASGRAVLDEGRWVTLNTAMLDEWPNSCAMCLNDAETTFQGPLKGEPKFEDGPPVCDDCHRKLIMKWWGLFMLSGGATLLAAGLVAVLVPGVPVDGRWTIFGLIGGVAALVVGILVPVLRIKTAITRRVDPGRCISAIKFPSTGYAELMRGLAMRAMTQVK